MRIELRDDLPGECLHGTWISSAVALSPPRMRVHSRDSRWRTRYVIAVEGGAPVGVLPIYQPRFGHRPYAEYDPHAVAPELFSALSQDSRHWLLVGGRADLAAGTAVRGDLPLDAGDEVRRQLIRQAFRVALADGLAPIALYVRAEELAAFEAASAGTRAMAVGTVATLSLASRTPESYLASLSVGARQTVRKEWRELEALGIRASRVPAEDVIDEAAKLVAVVKNKYGIADYAPLASMRLRAWVASGLGRCLAFTVRGATGELEAVAFACHAGEVLEVYELGLDQHAPHRHLNYLEVTIYAPLRYAFAQGCRTMELGLNSPFPKRLRGAGLAEVFAVSASEDTAAGG